MRSTPLDQHKDGSRPGNSSSDLQDQSGALCSMWVMHSTTIYLHPQLHLHNAPLIHTTLPAARHCHHSDSSPPPPPRPPAKLPLCPFAPALPFSASLPQTCRFKLRPRSSPVPSTVAWGMLHQQASCVCSPCHFKASNVEMVPSHGRRSTAHLLQQQTGPSSKSRPYTAVAAYAQCHQPFIACNWIAQPLLSLLTAILQLPANALPI